MCGCLMSAMGGKRTLALAREGKLWPVADWPLTAAFDPFLSFREYGFRWKADITLSLFASAPNLMEA